MKTLLACILIPIGCISALVALAVVGSIFLASSVVVAAIENDVRVEIAATDPDDVVHAILARAQIGGRALEGIVHVDSSGSTDRVLVRIRQNEVTPGEIRDALRSAIESLERTGELPPGAARLAPPRDDPFPAPPATLPSRRVVR